MLIKMILITGGTGFIGKALIRHLVEGGYQVRSLIRPSLRSPNLPKGVPVEVAVSGLKDERGLRAAMVGVDTVYHLASAERLGNRGSLLDVDIQGTQAIVQVAVDAGVQRFFYLSHLGADRASAYPVFKAKAIAEEHIRRSGIDYTILRTAMVFGPNDGFTTGIASLLHTIPFVFFYPGEGDSLLQPLWIEDLVTCLAWAMEYDHTRGQLYEVGGPEYLPFKQIVETIAGVLQVKRSPVIIRPPYLRALTVFIDHTLRRLPVSVYWLDYLAANHTCSLDTLPHAFNLMPARFSQRLAYLKGRKWRMPLIKAFIKRSTT
jgi:uncharacterized protein YbjT (DUF2867 family)